VGELFFILFEVAEPCGAPALLACPNVSLTYLSCIPDALHRCFTDLIEHGAGDSWTPRSARRAMASHPPCTPSLSMRAGAVGKA
jgi:hypothetical protein